MDVQTLRTYAEAGVKAVRLARLYSRLQLFDFISHSGGSSSFLPARESDAAPDQQYLHEQRDMFRLVHDESRSADFVLSDGRKIGFAYYGAQSGPTVFYLHGFPGCRLSGVFFDGPGKKLGARIIAVERPAIGISSPQPGRKPLDHANDLRELAEHLNLESYGIIGLSGGAPYALACAYSLPEEKLKAVSIIGGMGPIDVGIKGMNFNNWLIFKGFMYFPAGIRWVQNKVATMLRSAPDERIVEVTKSRFSKQSYKWLSPNEKDIGILRDPEFITLMLVFYREHYKQGVEGYMEEGRVLTSDLGFRVEDIRASLPIQLWYGRQDTNVPLRIGEEIATRLRSRPDLYVKDETHLGLALKYSFDALERLLEKM